MKTKDATEWLRSNAKRIERFSGRWVAFNVDEGVVSKGRSLDLVLRAAKRKKSDEAFVLHVPSPADLGLNLSRKR